jgi:hypothetical protein
MHTSLNTELNFDKSGLSECAEIRRDLQVMVTRALPAPSPVSVSEIVRRTFQRDLEPSSSGSSPQHTSDNHAQEYFEITYKGCTVHLAKMVCASYGEHEAAISRASQGLRPGDIVILESLDLSTGHCFPYHSAFGRFQEILALLQQATGHPTTHEQLKRLNGGRSSEATIQMGVPVKLQGDQKSLPALVLECIRPCIEPTHMVSMDEYDTVTAELKRIGKDADVAMRSFTINRILYTI